MAASREEVYERVKEVLTEQLGVEEGDDHRRGLVPGGSRRGFARPRRADHGARGSVRNQDLRRGRPEDPDRRPGRRLRLLAPVARATGDVAPLRKLIEGLPDGSGRAGLHARLVGDRPRRTRTSGSSSSATACSSSRWHASSTSAIPTSPKGGSRRSARTSCRARAAQSSRASSSSGRSWPRRGADIPADELERLSRNRNVLAALLEAALAALFLEHGFEKIEQPIVQAFAGRIDYALNSHVDYKTELQEALARRGQVGELFRARGGRACRTIAASRPRRSSTASSSASAAASRRRPPSRRPPRRPSRSSGSRCPPPKPRESCALRAGSVARRFALNVRGPSPRTPHGGCWLALCSLPCGHGRFASAPASVRLRAKPGSAWS